MEFQLNQAKTNFLLDFYDEFRVSTDIFFIKFIFKFKKFLFYVNSTVQEESARSESLANIPNYILNNLYIL